MIPPKTVMRFYGNSDFAMECIALKQITFVHIDRLNDPFDLCLFIDTDFNESYETLIQRIEFLHPLDIKDFKSFLPQKNLSLIIAELREKFAKFRDNYFVLSTSAVNDKLHPRDNLYMWGHYGNGHRGIAIEFNSQLLASSAVEYSKKLDAKSSATEENAWVEIKYEDKMSKLTSEILFEFYMHETGKWEKDHNKKSGLEQFCENIARQK